MKKYLVTTQFERDSFLSYVAVFFESVNDWGKFGPWTGETREKAAEKAEKWAKENVSKIE